MAAAGWAPQAMAGGGTYQSLGKGLTNKAMTSAVLGPVGLFASSRAEQPVTITWTRTPEAAAAAAAEARRRQQSAAVAVAQRRAARQEASKKRAAAKQEKALEKQAAKKRKVAKPAREQELPTTHGDAEAAPPEYLAAKVQEETQAGEADGVGQSPESIEQSGPHKPNQSVLESAHRMTVGSRRIQSIAQRRGGPESRRAAQDLVKASVKYEQIAARFSLGMPLALAMGELSAAAKAWEQACRIDGRPEWFAPAHIMVESSANSEQEFLRLARLKPDEQATEGPQTLA